MRKRAVRSGLRFIVSGIVCIILATFFPEQISGLLFLGTAGAAKVTFLGFFIGWACAGLGCVMAAIGVLQGGIDDVRIRLLPTFLLLVSLFVLFFVLAYSTVTRPPARHLEPGESINI